MRRIVPVMILCLGLLALPASAADRSPEAPVFERVLDYIAKLLVGSPPDHAEVPGTALCAAGAANAKAGVVIENGGCPQVVGTKAGVVIENGG